MALPFSQTIRSLDHDNAKLAYLVWSIAGILLAIWLGWFMFGNVTMVEVSRQARLQAAEAPHPVEAVLAGKVTATRLAVGARVAVGDVLVELDASSEELDLQEEEARVAANAERITALKREIAAREQARAQDLLAARAASDAASFRSREADIAVAYASDAETRTAKLSAQGGATKVEAMKAAAEAQKLAASRDALTSDARRLTLEAEARGYENQAEIEGLKNTLVTLEGEAATSALTIRRLKLDIERHLIRAPVAGKLGDVVPVQIGTYVTEGARMATVIPDGDLIITAEFDPTQTLGRVRPGQTAELSLDGFPWGQYGRISATVRSISSEVRDNNVHAEFNINAVPATGIKMEHGLPGSIEVTVEQVSPASLVMRSIGLILAPTAQGATP